MARSAPPGEASAPLRLALLTAGFCLAVALGATGAWRWYWGEPYLKALNQAFIALLWAQVLALALGRGFSITLGGAASALAAFGLAFAGLAARGIVPAAGKEAVEYLAPLLACGLAAGLTLALMSRVAPRSDPALAGSCFTLFAMGLAVLARFVPELSAEGRQEVLAALAWRQAFWFVAGCGALCLAAAKASPARLARLARKKYLYPLLAAVLLLATFAVGPQINGRRLWLDLGLFTLQTVELVKFLMVFFVAGYFAGEHPQALAHRSLWAGRQGLSVLGPLVLMHLLPLLALFVQRDFGPAVLLYGFFLLMAYVGTGNRMAPLAGLALVLAAGVLGWWFKTPSMLAHRVEAWLDPFAASEQMARALWSLAEGGLSGAGWGLGRPQAVPLAYSDFAFVAVAHELGLAGAMAVAAMFGVLAWRGLSLASRLEDPLSRLLAAGISVMMTLQALMVLGGVTGLIPLAGLTLPFVSHGGSSLVVNLGMAGVLIRLSARA